MGINIWKKTDNIVVIFIGLIVIIPMVLLREDYSFTVHDYLDFLAPQFEVLRNSGIFFSPDSPMSVLGGMSTCFLNIDFGVYRWLNFLFGFVWAEIINRGLAIVLGYFSMMYLLSKFDYANENIGIKKLVSICYAINPVYPMWALSFAVLPFIIRYGTDCFSHPQKNILNADVVYLAFGFIVYFPAVGFFVIGIWLLSAIISSFAYKKLNLRMFYIFIFMLSSSIVANINIFIYSINGVETNRLLFVPQKIYGIGRAISRAWKTMVHGQYHAMPILDFIVPVVIIAFLIMLYCRIKKSNFFAVAERVRISKAALYVFVIMFSLSFISVYDPLIKIIFSHIISSFSGFNFSRIHFLINPLWYLLFFLVLTWVQTFFKNRLFFRVILLIQAGVILTSAGHYQDTYANITRVFNSEKIISYKNFYSVDYFSRLKSDIGYNNEGCISVGYHPAIAMYNGFNTLDGYVPVNPMSYHDDFREIIAPTLDKFPKIRSYYDRWGGRMYVYTSPGDRDTREFWNVSFTSKHIIEKRNLYINVDKFVSMGGKYIFSKFIIENADIIGIKLLKLFEIPGEPYHIYIYTAS